MYRFEVLLSRTARVARLGWPGCEGCIDGLFWILSLYNCQSPPEGGSKKSRDDGPHRNCLWKGNVLWHEMNYRSLLILMPTAWDKCGGFPIRNVPKVAGIGQSNTTYLQLPETGSGSVFCWLTYRTHFVFRNLSFMSADVQEREPSMTIEGYASSYTVT